MYNFQQDTSIIKELGLRPVSMKYMTEETILDDTFYTINCVDKNNKFVSLDIALTPHEAKLKYLEFSKIPNIKIIYYPCFITIFNGTIDISKKLIIIEGRDHPHPYFFPIINPDFYVILKKSIGTGIVIEYTHPNAPINLFNDFIRYLSHIFCKVKGFIEMDKHICLEWSYGKIIKTDFTTCIDKYLVFYDFKVID